MLSFVGVFLATGAEAHAGTAKPNATERALHRLEEAVGDATNPAEAGKLLRKHGVGLSSFDRGLLQAEVTATQPSVTAALRSVSAKHHATQGQLKVLIGALETLRHNPAMQALKRRGRYLKTNPQALKGYLRDALDSRVATAASAGEEKFVPKGPGAPLGQLSKIMSTPAIGKVLARTRAMINRPGGLKKITSLPPLVLASFIPPQDLGEGGGRASASAAAAPNCGGVKVPDRPPPLSLSEEEKETLLTSALKRVNKAAEKIGAILIKYGPSQGTRIAGLIVSLGLTLPEFATVAATVEAAGTVVEAIQVFEALWNSYFSIYPSYLELSPRATTLKPNEVQSYSACAVDHFGNVVGPATIQHLTISGHTTGFFGCQDDACHAIELGTHAVIAETRGARGYATLTVEPGELVELRIDPYSSEITAGDRQNYQVHGFDNWGNDLGMLGSSSKFGSASLSISPSGGSAGAECQADWCTAKRHGTFSVRATVPGSDWLRSETATLMVKPKGPLTITPQNLGPRLPDLNFTEQFDAQGGRGPVNWEFEILKSTENCPNCAFYGFTPDYFRMEPSGLLHGRGLQPGESLVAEVRAWDEEGYEGEEEIEMTGSAPPSCATVCLYPGTGEIHYPVPTTFGAAFNLGLSGGEPTFRYIYDGVVLNPWPEYWPTAYNGFEAKSFTAGQEWWVPWTYAWTVRWPDLEPGHTLALELVEDYRETVEGQEKWFERKLATSNTVVLK